MVKWLSIFVIFFSLASMQCVTKIVYRSRANQLLSENGRSLQIVHRRTPINALNSVRSHLRDRLREAEKAGLLWDDLYAKMNKKNESLSDEADSLLEKATSVATTHSPPSEELDIASLSMTTSIAAAPEESELSATTTFSTVPEVPSLEIKTNEVFSNETVSSILLKSDKNKNSFGTDATINNVDVTSTILPTHAEPTTLLPASEELTESESDLDAITLITSSTTLTPSTTVSTTRQPITSTVAAIVNTAETQSSSIQDQTQLTNTKQQSTNTKQQIQSTGIKRRIQPIGTKQRIPSIGTKQRIQPIGTKQKTRITTQNTPGEVIVRLPLFPTNRLQTKSNALENSRRKTWSTKGGGNLSQKRQRVPSSPTQAFIYRPKPLFRHHENPIDIYNRPTYQTQKKTHQRRPSWLLHPSSSGVRSSYGCTREGYFRDHSQCTRFYRCVRQSSVWFDRYEFSCGVGLVFNEQLAICVWPDSKDPCHTVYHYNEPDMLDARFAPFYDDDHEPELPAHIVRHYENARMQAQDAFHEHLFALEQFN